MNMKILDLGDDPIVSVKTNNQEISASLYSDEGKSLIDTLALKQSVFYRTMYDFRWLGVRIIQFPADLIALQQLFVAVKPTLVIETGVAHGGSLIYSASLMKLNSVSSGRVIGIDIDIREENRKIIESHPLSSMITLFESSSTSARAIDFVKNNISENDIVLVILDSSHSREHVSRELALYSNFVTKGSYILPMDGALGYIGDVPGQSVASFLDNPLPAITDFLDNHPEFEADDIFDKLGVTSSPMGALKRTLV